MEQGKLPKRMVQLVAAIVRYIDEADMGSEDDRKEAEASRGV